METGIRLLFFSNGWENLIEDRQILKNVFCLRRSKSKLGRTMWKVFVGLMVSFGLWAVMPNSAIAGCNPDPCPEGQTCRYEQPNTFYCKSYNNVSGSQGAFGQQGSTMPGGPQFSAPNRGTPAGQSAGMRGAISQQRASDCAGSNVACVDVQINDSPYSVPSVFAAIELVLEKQLEGQRIFSLNVQPNDASMRLVQGQRVEVENALYGLLNHRFVERPDLPAITNITDLMPPPDFLNRIDPMSGSELARLTQMYGYDAMQAAMQDIQRLARESGGSWAFLALLFSAEAANAVTVVTGTIATGFLIYDHLKEEEKPQGGSTTIIVQPGGTLTYTDGDKDKIIAEKDVNMLMNAYKNLATSMQNLASVRGMY
jgi:hypothetical protein